jgi:hypothetical protein
VSTICAVGLTIGLTIGLCAGWLRAADAPVERQQVEFFERHIRPFLASDCYECHGARKQEGGLRVDSREALLKGGTSGPALVAFDADRSLLQQSIDHTHPEIAMPQDRPQLPAEVRANFRRWINEGAVDPRDAPPPETVTVATDWPQVFAARKSHWCFQQPVLPPLPSVTNREWPQGPVDYFVLSKLNAHDLEPSAPAARNTWLRRVTFALTGLPPTPGELTAFLADTSPTAQSRVVDRLLASPDFGEHWARHWMDLVRYAESYGHEQDYEIRHAWRYRDYLIRAFNDDLAYDQFIYEHVAGDLLSPQRRNPATGLEESVIATGFWYLHQATHAPVDPLMDEAERIDNQIDVFSKAFLGLTVSCARCHDHKFDAISTRDYYRLTACLRSTRQNITTLDPHGVRQQLGLDLQNWHEQNRDTVRNRVREATQHPHPLVAQYLLTAKAVLQQRGGLRVLTDSPPVASAPTTSSAPPEDVLAAASSNNLRPEVLNRWLHELTVAFTDPAHPLQDCAKHLSAVQATTTDGSTNADIDARAIAPTGISQTSSRTSPSAPDRARAASSRFPFAADEPWFPSGQAFRHFTNSPRSEVRVSPSRIELLTIGSVHSGLVSDKLVGVLRTPTFPIADDYLHLRVSGMKGQVRLVIARYALREFNPLLFGETHQDIDTNGVFQWRTLSADVRRYKGKLAYLELHDTGPGFIALDQLVFTNDSSPPRPATVAESAQGAMSYESSVDQVEQTCRRSLKDWLEQRDTAESRRILEWLSQAGLVESFVHIPAANRSEPPQQADVDLSSMEPQVLSMAEGTAETAYILVRGNPQSPGDRVDRQFLEALGGDKPLTASPGSGRLQLAHALVDPANPLVDRVFVNRVWAHLFGRGLVSTVDNFGALGQPPTHPELLDYLALRFRAQGRSLKLLLREICLSQTYAMSSDIVNLDNEEKDPANTWLHRQHIRRLTAESLRDTLLAVSGQLDRAKFGVSVPTYLSPFLGDPSWLTGRGVASGPLDGHRRRSVYQEIRRNFLNPFLTTFDFPTPDSTNGQRNTSNVPGQALALMNDPFVKQQATALAEQIVSSPTRNADERLTQLYLVSLGRTSHAVERDTMKQLLLHQATVLGITAEQAENDLRVWSDLCHLVFLLKEFCYVP